ncbi:hypothetical protein [Pseudorhodoplanes sp.]|uniref:hypothetical protein n=1 Tax=Pseudorhodoplanes sp. TaxID=1934341 RepID=UPI003D0A413C
MPVLPADIDTALAQPGWRRNLRWPVSLAQTNAICEQQVRDALGFAGALDDPLMRDAVLLALPNALAYGRAIVLAALAVGRAEQDGFGIAGAAAELQYLQTGEGPLPARAESTLPSASFGLTFARRLARMRSWTPLSRMPRAMLAPGAVAISHNPLLRDVAGRERRGVGFHHAETILGTARLNSTESHDVADMSRALAVLIVDAASLDAPYRERAMRLVGAVVLAHLGKAARDMAALRLASLPKDIWTGSGGLHAPRAIGLEVLRRGGHVRRFDHGTPREFVATAGMTELLELSVSSEFTLPTEDAAAICRREMMKRASAVQITGGTGDPVFRRVPPRRPSKPRAGKPRVVYAPTQLLGFRQLVPALPPDPVHLDWQMRVAEFLNTLPVDFVCQAHPEGLFGGRPHPLEALVPVRRGNFQVQLAEADVFVFDYPTTTALWEACCTDAQIVYLDMGAGRMTPQIARLFAQRATILPVSHDDDHRMQLDEHALRDAILAKACPADPSAFRCLLAGTA